MKFLVINGPNMNMLGIREPEIYGNTTYSGLCVAIAEKAASLGASAEFFQSNHEGAIVDKIQSAYGAFDGIIINAAAYTHTSVAIPDAIRSVGIPAAEVHISDPDKREDFRKVNFLRPACVITVSGKGIFGYGEAMGKLAEFIEKRKTEK